LKFQSCTVCSHTYECSKMKMYYYFHHILAYQRNDMYSYHDTFIMLSFYLGNIHPSKWFMITLYHDNVIMILWNLSIQYYHSINATIYLSHHNFTTLSLCYDITKRNMITGLHCRVFMIALLDIIMHYWLLKNNVIIYMLNKVFMLSW
jgi:hypothetical protein